MLWSIGEAAPDFVFAHGWITIDGQKMGKSLGNAVDPFALAERFGADSLRYFLLREAPFGSDFSYSEEKIAQRHNSDLGNDLGNLLHRTASMVQKYRDGIVPQRGAGRQRARACASPDLPALVRERRPRTCAFAKHSKRRGSSSPRSTARSTNASRGCSLRKAATTSSTRCSTICAKACAGSRCCCIRSCPSAWTRCGGAWARRKRSATTGRRRWWHGADSKPGRRFPGRAAVSADRARAGAQP